MKKINKFKVWDKQEKKCSDGYSFGISHDGLLFENVGIRCQECGEYEQNFVDKDRYEVVWSTGVKDGNGGEIYVGDIVRYAYIYSHNYDEADDLNIPDDEWIVGEVVWCGDDDYPAFDLKKHDFDANAFAFIKQSGLYIIEIIGCIRTTPELLEVSNDD